MEREAEPMDPSKICVGHRGRKHGAGGSNARAGGRRAGRPNRRRLAGVVVVGAASATMLFGPAGMARAGDCPITNLDLTCTSDVVDDLQQTVDQTVEETIRTAEDDLAAVADTAASTLDGLTDTVGQPPGGDEPGGDDGHDGGVPNHDPAGSTNGHVRRPGSAAGPGAQLRGPSVQIREGGTITAIGTATTGHADPSDADAIDQRPGPIGLREAATGIALSLLDVAGAVLLFMAIQARLDRRDPKLALAPVTADVVTFA